MVFEKPYKLPVYHEFPLQITCGKLYLDFQFIQHVFFCQEKRQTLILLILFESP